MIKENSILLESIGLEKESIFKKAYGSLLGVAYGDAMGMPTSLMDPVTIRKIFPERITKLLPAPEGHMIHNKMLAGEITDDTQQTLLLADLFIEEKKFTRYGVARKLLEWAKSLNAFQSMILGPSSLRALKMIDDGIPVEETGSMGDTNGAAMKIAPVGIVHPGDYRAVVDDVAEVCIPTHNTNVAIAGAAAVACAVASGMANKNMDELIQAFYYGAAEGLKFGRQWYGASILKRAELALKIIRAGKSEIEIWQDLYDYVGTGVAISESVPAALALVVYYNGNPLKTAEAAANIGGDCDTIGAIAGGIAGAYSGCAIFPSNIIDQLSRVNKIDFEGYAKKIANSLLTK
ncbi:MAG: ADP-ribosylglycohydrolase family protein [Bacteroidota bacterium]